MLHEFARPERCVVGTVGEPGNRLFIIQVSERSTLVSVAVEKVAVETLSRRVLEILEQLESLGHIGPGPDGAQDMGPLDAPLEVAFRAGAIGLAWDAGRSALQLELFSFEVGESDDESPSSMVQVWLTPRQAREFALRARQIVAAGRPACPFCGQPVGAEGHICPRSNGYRSPLFL